MYALIAKEGSRAGIRYSESEKKSNPALTEKDYYNFVVYPSGTNNTVTQTLRITTEPGNNTIRTFSIDGVTQNTPAPEWVKKLLAAANNGHYSRANPRTFELKSEGDVFWYQADPVGPESGVFVDLSGEIIGTEFTVYRSSRTEFSLPGVELSNTESTEEPVSPLRDTPADAQVQHETEEQSVPEVEQCETQGTEQKKEAAHEEVNLPEDTLGQEKDKAEKYIEKLLTTTQKYKENLPAAYAPIHAILNELIQGLQREKNSRTIEDYYKVLARIEPGNNENNLKIIEKNQHRSTKHFIMGIAALTLTIVTGILPGLITMAVVYAITRKTPLSLFKTQSDQFIDDLKQIEENYRSFENHLDL